MHFGLAKGRDLDVAVPPAAFGVQWEPHPQQVVLEFCFDFEF